MNMVIESVPGVVPSGCTRAIVGVRVRTVRVRPQCDPVARLTPKAPSCIPDPIGVVTKLRESAGAGFIVTCTLSGSIPGAEATTYGTQGRVALPPYASESSFEVWPCGMVVLAGAATQVGSRGVRETRIPPEGAGVSAPALRNSVVNAAPKVLKAVNVVAVMLSDAVVETMLTSGA